MNIKDVVLTLSLAAAAATTGCASSNPPFLTAQTVQTNIVTEVQQVVQTNTVVQTNVVTVTNGVSQTNLVSVVVPVLQTNLVSQTNTVTITNGYQVSAAVSNVLADAGMVNSVTAPLNPYSGLVSGVLALAAGGLGWYARLKTKQAQQHLSTASTIITAVEGLAPAVAQGVKTAVANQAVKMGTADNVQATVQAVTQNLPSS